MPDLIIRMKKKTDGTSALSCTRADGSVTWQRQQGRSGQFFPRHDLTHYAVETVLGHRRGFYGLIAEGWDFGDFGAPWPRGPLPANAEPAELIVGLLDAERASNVEWTLAELTAAAEKFITTLGESAVLPTPLLTEEQLARIRARRRELFARWDAVVPGATLELEWWRDSEMGETP